MEDFEYPEDVDCTICHKLLDEEAIERLHYDLSNASTSRYDRDEDINGILDNAMCTHCYIRDEYASCPIHGYDAMDSSGDCVRC